MHTSPSRAAFDEGRAACREQPADLAALLAPFGVDTFTATYWQRRPLHTQGVEATRFGRWLSLDQLEALLASARSHDVHLYQGTTALSRSDYINAEGGVETTRLLGLYRQGSTLRLTQIQHSAPAVRQLCRELQQHFEGASAAQLWLSSETEFPSTLTQQAHDQFVLQLLGTQHLHVLMPDTASRGRDGAADGAGEAMTRLRLQPGELLYLPAGVPHRLIGADAHTAQLRLSVAPRTWREVLQVALSERDLRRQGSSALNADRGIEMVMAGEDESRLRDRLQEACREALAAIDVRALQHRLATERIDQATPAADGQWTDELMGDEPTAAASPASGCIPFEELGALIAPMRTDEFLAKHWCRTPLLVRAEGRHRFESLFPISDIEPALVAAAPHARHWQLFSQRDEVTRDSWITPHGHVRLPAVLTRYRSGTSVRLDQLQLRHAGLNRTCHALAMALRGKTQAQMWLSRGGIAGTQAYDYLHYDNCEQFVLQVLGSRHWKVYARQAADFSPRRPQPDVDRRDYGEPLLDVVLHPADMLYLPAGCAHDVDSAAPHSVHLVLAVAPVTWRDLLDAALERLDEAGSPLAEALPLRAVATGEMAPWPGDDELTAGLAQALQGVVSQLGGEGLQTALRTWTMRCVPPPHDGHIAREVLTEPALHARTRVRRRAGMLATVRVDARREHARLRCSGGGEMLMPGALAPLLQTIADTEGSFSASELPADYDLPSRVLVLGELLRLGLLERAAGRMRARSSKNARARRTPAT